MSNLFRDNLYNEFPDPNKKIEEVAEQADINLTDIAALKRKSAKESVDFVEDYKADPTGVEDCTSKLQQALEYCSAKKITLVANGVFLLKGTINLANISFMSIKGSNITRGQYGYPFETNCTSLFKTEAATVFDGGAYKELNIRLERIAFMNNKYGALDVTFFKNVNLLASIVTHSAFAYYFYWLYGGIKSGCYITWNTFYNTRRSVIYTRSDTVKYSIVDSWIVNNYFNAVGDKTDVIFLDCHYPNMTLISENFFEFSYKALNFSSGRDMRIHHNVFDYCFRGINIYQATTYSIMGNNFSHCGLAKAQAIAYWKVTLPDELLNTAWSGIQLGMQTQNVQMIGNIGDSDTTNLITMIDSSYKNVTSHANAISDNVDPYRTINLKQGFPGTYPDEGKGIRLSELNFITVATLPVATLTGYNRSSFDGQLIYYNGKLLRNDAGQWKDMMGTVVTS